MKEPTIFVNGEILSAGQAMMMRVALTEFHEFLCDQKTIQDLGEIGPLYKMRCEEILRMMEVLK